MAFVVKMWKIKFYGIMVYNTYMDVMDKFVEFHILYTFQSIDDGSQRMEKIVECVVSLDLICFYCSLGAHRVL